MQHPATILLISIASLALAACSTEPVQEQVQAEEQARTLELTAYVPAPASKVSVAPSGKVTWSSGDEIAVYNTSGKKFRATLSSGAGTSEGHFTCTFTGDPGTVAVYPYSLAGEEPGTVTLPWMSERSDDTPALMASEFSVSGTSVEPLMFKHIAPVIDFTLHDIPAYARALVLRAGGGRICGDFSFNTSTLGPVQTENVESSRIITFPCGEGYGTDLHFRLALPAGDYSKLSIGLIDGDESPIEGLEALSISSDCLQLSAKDYLVMPAVDVRSKCARRADLRKVEGIYWAAGNLIAEAGGKTSDGFQTGWRIADEQYEYLGCLTVGTSTTATYTQTAASFDRFNWGGLAGDAWLPDAGYMLPTTAKYIISGRIFSVSEGDSEALDAAQVSGDARFAAPVGGSLATGSTLHGDVAFWASRGQYRMPEAAEIVTLRAGETTTAASGKAGYVSVGGNRIYGILLTSTPSWEESTLNTTAAALTAADLESGLFLPKAGRGRFVDGTATINYVNGQGYYRSGTFSGLNLTYYPNCDHSTTILGFRAGNKCDYGYSIHLNSDVSWGVGHVQKCLPVRPVLASAGSAPVPDPLPQPSATSLPAWSEGYLDIHSINSGRGECTLVIMPDGTSMMIDAGEYYTTSETAVEQKPSAAVRPFKVYTAYAKYFLSATGHDFLDYFLLTHYHIDHMGQVRGSYGTSGNGYTRSGVMAVYDDLPILKLVDRCGPDNTPGTSDYSEAVYEEFRKFAEYRRSHDGMAWYQINLNASGNYAKQFAPKYNPSCGCTVYNVSGNGKYWNGSGFTSMSVSAENACCASVLISYGDFDYLNTGDVGTQSGMLQEIASGLGKGVDAMKAGHHMYYNTFNDSWTAEILQPQVTIAQIFDSDKPGDPSFGLYRQYGDVFCTNLHPGRLDNSVELKAGTPVSNLGSKVRDYGGHFVIRVSPGGTQFYVYKLRDTDFSYTVEATYGPYTCN